MSLDRAAKVISRQELAIKLVFAMRSGAADVAAVVQRQRVATVRALQDVTRLKAAAQSAGDLAWLLMLDALVFQAEAEARWLDMCQARLARERANGRSSGPCESDRTSGGTEQLMVVLDIEGAGRVFGAGRLRVVALDDVSLRVSAGEFVAVSRALAVRASQPCCGWRAGWTGRPPAGPGWQAATWPSWMRRGSRKRCGGGSASSFRRPTCSRR